MSTIDPLGKALRDPLSDPIRVEAPAMLHTSQITLSPYLPDGEVYALGGGCGYLVGIAPVDEVTAAGREARQAVRDGMADVLAWLGEPVEGAYSTESLLRRLRDPEAA